VAAGVAGVVTPVAIVVVAGVAAVKDDASFSGRTSAVTATTADASGATQESIPAVATGKATLFSARVTVVVTPEASACATAATEPPRDCLDDTDSVVWSNFILRRLAWVAAIPLICESRASGRDRFLRALSLVMLSFCIMCYVVNTPLALYTATIQASSVDG
jgi:hypothetical protein